MTRGPRAVTGSPERKRHPRPLAHPEKTRGFTLVELLIVLTITPVIVGALTLGLVMVFSLQHGISSRISDAGDAQVVSSTYLKDVQSASMITEEPSLACGSGMTYASTPTQVLGLEWGGNGGSYVNTVSYITVPNPGLSTYSLIRQFCTADSTSIAAQVNTVATDLTEGTASALLSIQCEAIPVNPDCNAFAPSPPAPTNTPLYETTWINAGDVQDVFLSAQETSLLPQPNSNVPFELTLSASPRFHPEASSTSGGQSAPLTVLGTNCSTPALEITNGVIVSINVAGGTGNGTLGLSAKCKAVAVDNGGTLLAGSILTTNPQLNSVYDSPSPPGGTYPIPEYYASNVPDPLASLVPPSTDTNLNPGKCVQVSGVWNCSAGYYAQDPGAHGALNSDGTVSFGDAPGQTINFNTTNCTPGPDGCRFLFGAGLSLVTNDAVNFASGVYVFVGGTGSAISVSTGVNINGAVTGGTQLLFYIASGSATFAPGLTINMAGLPDYKGVTIWDDDSSNPLTIAPNSGGGASLGYGGIYVRHEGIAIKNNGVLTVSFMVAQWMTFDQNITINITTP